VGYCEKRSLSFGDKIAALDAQFLGFSTQRAVTGGLTADDQVVISGMQKLRAGTKIQPELAKPTPPPETGDAQTPPAPPAGQTKR
jgi:hypothetical protein